MPYQPPVYRAPGTSSNEESRGQAQARQDRVFEAASRKGLKDTMLRVGTSILESTAFKMLSGAFEREASAMASIVDVLQGTGKKGEGVGARWIREAIGGTQLGDVFDLDDPDREGWDATLEQAGMAKGMTLSELITGSDKPWLIDPTARGALAMCLEIGTAPTSWLTAGAGPAARKMAGKAGSIIATKKGQDLAYRLYRSKVLQRAQALDEAVPAGLRRGSLTDEAAATFQKLERKVLRRESEELGLQGLGDAGLAQAANRIEFEAMQAVADRVLREGTKGLSQKAGLRFGDTRFLGLNQAGILLLDQAVLARPAKALMAAIRSGKAAPIVENIDEFIGWADKVFKRVPRALRTNAIFRAVEKQRFISRNSAGEVSETHLARVFGDKRKFFRKNKAAARMLMHFIEQPEKYEPIIRERFGADGFDAFRRVRRRWTTLADGMGAGAVKHEFITQGQFQTYQGRYISHELDWTKLDQKEFGGIMESAIGQEFKGGSIYRYGNERRAQTLEQLEGILAGAGKNVDEVINWNAETVMANYIKTHVRGVADSNFANDMVAHFSPTFKTVLSSIAPEISEMAARVKPGDLKKIQALKELARISKDTPLYHSQYKAAIKAAESMPGESRAAYLYEMMHNLNGPEEFFKFYEDHLNLIKKTSNSDLSSVRAFSATGQFWADGVRVVSHPFTEGRLAGQSRLIPIHMTEFFVENSKQLSKGLPRVVEDALKVYDLLQNTFKVTHTIFAPAFHVRNSLSNVAAVAQVVGLAPFLNPRMASRVAKVLLGKGGDFTVTAANGRRYTRTQLRGLYDALDINPKRVQQAELVGGRQTLITKLPGLGNFEHAIGKTSQGSENFARGLYFQTLLERGYSPARAAELVKEALFDYNDLSWTEANIFRRLFPFYTWTRKNAEFQIKTIAQHPGATAAQVRLLNERGPESDLLPEYMRGELKVKLESKPGRALFLTNLDLPVSNVDVLWKGGLGKTMANWIGMVSPFLKSPSEFALDYDSFSQRSIKGQNFIGQLGPEIERTWPKPVQGWLELERIQAGDGRVFYKANGLKMWLLFKNVLVGRLVRDSTRAADTVALLGQGNKRDGAAKLLRVLSGLSLEDLQLDLAQKRKLDENVRRWEDFLVGKGALAETKIRFTPKGQ